MKHKSIFPYLFLLFGLMLIAGNFSHSPGIQNNQKQWKGLSISKAGNFERFQKITDTALSTHFQLKNYLVNTGAASGLKINYDPGHIRVKQTPVFDTILECRYKERLLFKELSLKTLVSASESDTQFWGRAGLEIFEVDMLNSNDDRIVCRFTFRDQDSEEVRSFRLHIDQQGKTRIFET